MENTVLLFIVIIGTLTEAYMPAIKIYEIRKTRDIDDNYYDMSFLKKTPNDNRNVKLESLVSNIIDKLQNLSKRDRDDDRESSDYDFIDKTRSLPVLIYKKPKRNDLLQSLLGSVLRSQDVEDRTAPPRHGPLEYDY